MNAPGRFGSKAAAAPTADVVVIRREGRDGLSCWLALPAQPRAGALPLVAVHGISRGSRDKATAFAARAAAQGRVVIAPEFDEERWKSYQRVVSPKRADLALLELLEALRAEGVVDAARFHLFGYSGGAQFAHRFAMLYPHLLGRLSVSAAGWWTFPDAAAFPYGLGGEAACGSGAQMAAGLQRFLALEMVVSVGAQDCVSDANTRRSPELDAQQGDNRLARALAWVAALKAAAAERGLPAPNLRFAVLAGCGHDFLSCAAADRGALVSLTLPDGDLA